MDLQENLRKKMDTMEKKLNLDTFGKAMDTIIEASRVGLLVTKAENSKAWKVDGAGCGAVMDFYIILSAIEPIFMQMLKEMEEHGFSLEVENTAEAMAELIKDTLIGAAQKKGA